MKKILLVAVLAFIGSWVFAQERIAVFPFEDMDNVLTLNQAKMFYQAFSDEFAKKNAGRFIVVERQDVDRLFTFEKDFQLDNLNNLSAPEKTAETERVPNPTRIISGRIGMVENSIRITVSLYTFPELTLLPVGTSLSVANTTELFNKIPELVRNMQNEIAKWGIDPEGIKDVLIKEELSIKYTDEINKLNQHSGSEKLKAYRQIISELTPQQRSSVEYRGLRPSVNLYNYLEEQIKILTIIVREEYFSDARFYSIGGALGSSFVAPWLIGTFQLTLSPLKYMFIETACDFGFLHGYYSERSDIKYHSVYLFGNIGGFFPLNQRFSLYAGIGGGYLWASYRTSEEENFFKLPALNISSGMYMYIGKPHWYANGGYSLRINPSGGSPIPINHKVFIGVNYRL